MMKKFWGLLFVFCAILTGFEGMRGARSLSEPVIPESGGYNKHYPVKIQTFDSSGRPVEMIFTQKPQHVVTDELNTFETLLALGLGDTIEGTSVRKSGASWQRLKERYPQEIGKVNYVYEYNLDLETVLTMQPDFILGWKSSFSPQRFRSTRWWNQKGVNTYVVATSNHVLQMGTIEDECRFLNDMGQIFDVTDQTDQRVQDIHDEIEKIKKQTAGRTVQNVMVIELMGRSVINYDEGWIVGDMVRQLGGYMPFHEKRLSYEDLVAYDPDVIFVNYFNEGQKEHIRTFLSDPKFNSMKAIRNHHIYFFPFEYMYTPAIKTIEGIKIVRDGLYPDLANDR